MSSIDSISADMNVVVRCDSHKDDDNAEYVETILLPLRRRLSTETVSSNTSSPLSTQTCKKQKHLTGTEPATNATSVHLFNNGEDCKENKCNDTDATKSPDRSNKLQSADDNSDISIPSIMVQESDIKVSSTIVADVLVGTPNQLPPVGAVFKRLKSCLSTGKSSKKKRIRSPLKTPTSGPSHQLTVNSETETVPTSLSPNSEPIQKKRRLNSDESMSNRSNDVIDWNISEQRKMVVQFAPSSAVEYVEEVPVCKSLTPIPPETATKRFPVEMKPLSDEELEQIRITKQNHAILRGFDDLLEFDDATLANDDDANDNNDGKSDDDNSIIIRNHYRRMNARRQQRSSRNNRRKSFYIPSTSMNYQNNENGNDGNNILLRTI